MPLIDMPLEHYRRVWEMDLAKDAYEELREYFRSFDPRHEREDEIFAKLGYIDIRHLACRNRGEAMMGVVGYDLPAVDAIRGVLQDDGAEAIRALSGLRARRPAGNGRFEDSILAGTIRSRGCLL